MNRVEAVSHQAGQTHYRRRALQQLHTALAPFQAWTHLGWVEIYDDLKRSWQEA